MHASYKIPALNRRRVALALGGLLVALAVWMTWRYFHRPDPLLTTPTLALEALRAKSLYFNEPARAWLLAQRPELLVEEDRDAQSERARGFVQAVQNPKLFRQLDRRYRFDTLLLLGDPSCYRPLLEHLVETKDWTLRYADHTSLVFKRDAERAWEPADLQPVRARMAETSARDRAVFLAQTGVKLLAAGQSAPAKQLLDEATRLDARVPDAWNGLAVHHMNRGEWAEALTNADRALALDKDFLPALATKTQVCYATRNFSVAYDLSRKLIEKLPDDPGTLFYHAKIAHEAHAYTAEVAALEKLIARAEAEERPVGGYQIYLGQAYASAGDAQRAIDSFMLALNDADLPNDQRAFARENIARIRKRMGL